MFKRPIFLFFLFFLLVSFGTLMLKVHVQNLALDVKNVGTERNKLNNEIRVLKAEWSYLNNAERVGKLAKRHLGLNHAKIRQVKHINKESSEPTKVVDQAPKHIRQINTHWRYKSRTGILKISNKKSGELSNDR